MLLTCDRDGNRTMIEYARLSEMKTCGMLEPLPRELASEFYAFQRLEFCREQRRRLPRSLKEWLSEQTLEIGQELVGLKSLRYSDRILCGTEPIFGREKQMD